MLNQFSRTQLVFGADNMEQLKNARVAVFGVGGVGGYTVEALARSGIGTLDLIDDDKVCLTNINRQILATRKTVGKYKVDVAEERIHEINPDAVVNTYKMFYLPETKDQFRFEEFEKLISEKSGKDKLVFVGDGINDAPVLMRSDIGISMGGVGSDAAIEASDIVLMYDDLKSIPVAKKVAKKTMKIVLENIIFAIAIKVSIMIIAVFMNLLPSPDSL